MDLASKFLEELDPPENPKKPKLAEEYSIVSSCLLQTQKIPELLGLISEGSSDTFGLIKHSSELIFEIESEVAGLCRSIKNIYKKKFPELEEIVTSHLEYSKVVTEIENNQCLPIESLKEILDLNLVNAIAMAGSCGMGTISESDRSQVVGISQEVFSLDEKYRVILEFIKTKVGQIAPNLSELLGSRVAGKVLGKVGGLDKLSRMPGSSIQGLLSNLVCETEVMQGMPQWLNSKAKRVLASKTVLAARVDSNKGSPEVGKDLKAQVQQKLEKAIEPPPMIPRKPLPVPETRPKKHRGGKRIRAAKRKHQITETQKQVNRVKFGTEAQEEFRETGHSFGMLGKSGKIREYSLSNPQAVQGTSSAYFDPKSGFSTVIKNKND